MDEPMGGPMGERWGGAAGGPDGGSLEKPVGTVCFGWAARDTSVEVDTLHFAGVREAIRRQSVEHALRGIILRAAKLDA